MASRSLGPGWRGSGGASAAPPAWRTCVITRAGQATPSLASVAIAEDMSSGVTSDVPRTSGRLGLRKVWRTPRRRARSVNSRAPTSLATCAYTVLADSAVAWSNEQEPPQPPLPLGDHPPIVIELGAG